MAEKFPTMWRALVTNGILAWKARSEAMRGLKNLQRLDESVLKLDGNNPVNRAKVALVAGNTATALRFWNEAIARYPNFAKGSPDALQILLGLSLFDDAEALMREAQIRSPRDPRPAGDYALVAERRGDIKEAILRWDRVRKKFPRYPASYVHGMVCLRMDDQLEAAEALSQKASGLFPDEVHVHIQRAQLAERRRDWPEALRRWEVVSEKFGNGDGDVGVARMLIEMGQFDEADQRLKQAQSKRPLMEVIAATRARLAERRGDKEEEVLRWADVVRRFPLLPLGYREGIRLLSEMGREADAEAILLAAIDRFSEDAWPMIEHARLASRQKDWATAVTRWADVRARWPDRNEAYAGGAAALAALGRQDEAAELKVQYQRLPSQVQRRPIDGLYAADRHCRVAMGYVPWRPGSRGNGIATLQPVPCLIAAYAA